MKPAKIIVLAIALLAAVGAWMLASRTPQAPAERVVETQAPIRTTDVLVAGIDLPVGQSIKPADIRWQPWPSDFVPAGAITKSAAPAAADEMAGSLVRIAILAGEPMRQEKLIKTNGTGFMSAILPSGMRAIAISIDTRGATSAGGFILPNDRVDVLRIYREEPGAGATGGDGQQSETVLSNIRVLAIGQNVQERNGEKVVTGETATLEVSPTQAETLALSQKVGQLSLTLRSLADANQPAETVRDDANAGLTVIRFGVPRSVAKR